ncbi:unannotated protein [freshwater metagenome]
MGQRFEAELHAHLDQQRNVSSTLRAEVKITSDRDEFCIQQPDKILSDKLGCCLQSALLVESHYKRGIDTTLSEKFELLIEISK